MYQSFINTDPSRTKHDSATRKQIRSLVMRQVSEKKRKLSKKDLGLDEEEDSPPAQSSSSPSSSSRTLSTSSSSKGANEAHGQFLMVKFDTDAKAEASARKQKRTRVKANSSAKRRQRDALIKALPRAGPVLPIVRLGPISNFPVDGQPYMHRMLAHYTTVVETGRTPPGQMNPMLSTWMPLAWTDPACFHSLMSVACLAYAAINEKQLSGLRGFYHQGHAVKAINKALSDPKRATSDAITAAVINSAIYEALLGNQTAWESHMKGLVIMVHIRGGTGGLGQEGIIEEMAYWADSIGGITLRTPIRFFPQLESSPESASSDDSDDMPSSSGSRIVRDTIQDYNKQIELFWTEEDTGDNQWQLHHSQFEKPIPSEMRPFQAEIDEEEIIEQLNADH